MVFNVPTGNNFVMSINDVDLVEVDSNSFTFDFDEQVILAGAVFKNADGSIQLINGTASMTQFLPIVRMVARGAGNGNFLQGQILSGDDSGSVQ